MAEASEVTAVYCRHCGVAPNVPPETADWLCEACDHYQDAAICPTCGSYTRVSALPAEMQPPAHKPVNK